MMNKWRIIFLLFVGSSVYYIGVERLEAASYASLLLFTLPMLLGWATCKFYSFLERKIDPQKYIQIVMLVFLIPATLGLFISISKNVSNKSWDILASLALFINAVFSMFFDKQGQPNPS